ncbi:hypothetical protein A3Q56_06008 [Intoshia linei]|uniref:DNA-directed RNA polymerase RpoA/D/Rpb3-type domain-containing protein n=1 Tax=Intoshia linei TaxID=1819745 RepID=A0A177AXZ0_9BILA|nr:hypothetical protein A3Q56_06008 [Intoshia linei]
MSASRIFNFKTHRGSFKGDDCNDWLRSLIDQCTEMGVISLTFVIENAPVHSKLESVIRIGEDAEIIRLAPYSYLLNPLELSWSCFKNEVKIKLRDEMPHMIAYRRINGISICEYRMRILERIANEAIYVLISLKLLHFSNHVERYYGAEFQKIFAPGVIKLEFDTNEGNLKSVVGNTENHTNNREVFRSKFKNDVVISKYDNYFLFFIESTGALKPSNIMIEAGKILINKCDTVLNALEEWKL